MSSPKSPAASEHEHVHGPDCDHDHHHHHDHDHHEPIMPFQRMSPKIGRNDPCHCGSGKKFKKCHGTADASAD